MTLSQLQQTIQSFRKQLAAREQAALETLAQAHQRTMQAIQPHLDTLLEQLDEAQQAGDAVSLSWLYEANRLQAIQALIAHGFESYGAYAQHLTALLQHQSVQLGLSAAHSLLHESLPGGVNWTFGLPSQDAIAGIVGATQAGSPLATLFNGFGSEAAQQAKQALINGVTLGDNPRVVAKSVHDALNVPYYRAQTIARTEMLRAYRDANTETYRANSDVLDGWRWTCALSARTCAACLAMDGEVFSVDEDMESHPNCRCVPVPITKSWSDILDGTGIDTSALSDTGVTDGMQSGADWLASQPEAVQQQVLGKSGYALYSNGTPLSDFVTVTHSSEWGKSIQQTPVRELVKR